ncbi:MAG: hypothetical protein J6J38_07715 [Lachnospiraceae bacterium]|nr:hypothetical protein [Lachnospiraceae bacterium]
MAFWKDVFRLPGSNEYEIKFAGNYGAKGEKRALRVKPTPEQIRKQNQRNREKKMRRLIKANFSEGDIWATLKYPAGTRKETDEVKKDIRKFLEKVRKLYKDSGTELKFILRMEIGARGGIHIHILMNRMKDVDLKIQKAWKQGRVNFSNVYSAGGYQALAEYIVKEPDTQSIRQMALFVPEEEQKEYCKYSTSRNLIRPVPERTVYAHRTVRKLVEEGPTPTPGYYIDRDSIVYGVNRFTGMSYLYYTEYELDGG